jgi:hypothetical protein
MAEAVDERLDLFRLASEFASDPEAVRMEIEQVERWGLILSGVGEAELSPMLLRAGRQFLEEKGTTDEDVLSFLPRTFDDLNTRRAVLHAGTVLVDEFGYAITTGGAIDYARELVPEAFAVFITERLAVDLYASAVALIARLSEGSPAGCVAEELLAVRLLGEAEAWLEMQADLGELTADSARSAIGELRSLFELFEDDDVLNLFAMREPSDAAVQMHEPIAQQMGIADQRIQSWFAPFNGLPVTGHLGRVEDRPRLTTDSPLIADVVEPAEIAIRPVEPPAPFRVVVRQWSAENLDDGGGSMPEVDRLYPEAETVAGALAGVVDALDDQVVRASIDVQPVGLSQAVKAGAAFHVVGCLEDVVADPAVLAAYLDQTFPAAVVVRGTGHLYIAVTANAESYEEAEVDVDDLLARFAEDHGLPELWTTGSTTGVGKRDRGGLIEEIEDYRRSWGRYRPERPGEPDDL